MPKHVQHTPPPLGQPERRGEYRREEDVEAHEIANHAVQEAPIVSQLLKTSKVAGAIAIVFTMIGGVTGAVATAASQHVERVKFESNIQTELDSNRRMIFSARRNEDSLFAMIRDIHTDAVTSKYIQCVLLRRVAPDLLPDGCVPTSAPKP